MAESNQPSPCAPWDPTTKLLNQLLINQREQCPRCKFAYCASLLHLVLVAQLEDAIEGIDGCRLDLADAVHASWLKQRCAGIDDGLHGCVEDLSHTAEALCGAVHTGLNLPVAGHAWVDLVRFELQQQQIQSIIVYSIRPWNEGWQDLQACLQLPGQKPDSIHIMQLSEAYTGGIVNGKHEIIVDLDHPRWGTICWTTTSTLPSIATAFPSCGLREIFRGYANSSSRVQLEKRRWSPIIPIPAAGTKHTKATHSWILSILSCCKDPRSR